MHNSTTRTFFLETCSLYLQALFTRYQNLRLFDSCFRCTNAASIFLSYPLLHKHVCGYLTFFRIIAFLCFWAYWSYHFGIKLPEEKKFLSISLCHAFQNMIYPLHILRSSVPKFIILWNRFSESDIMFSPRSQVTPFRIFAIFSGLND
jgi:hypothetical protein